jgi:hypothetical protein
MVEPAMKLAAAWLVVVVVSSAACDRNETAIDAASAPSEIPETRRSGDGRCEPEPREGQPCGPRDSWCALSWGQPGGHSRALWCRDGKWELEVEVNLPADEL